MNQRGRGFDPEQFFGPDGPFGPRGPLGPGGIFGPQGPFGTGGWPGMGGGQGFAGGGWAGERRGPRPGGRRARRGDVRSAILELLRERGAMNGYQLMQGIAEATDGAWTPSSGAIYPALSQLEDEGLVEQTEVEGRKAYRLTDAGRQAAENSPSLLWGREGGSEPEDPWSGSSARGEHAHGERRRGPHGRHGGPGRGSREEFRHGGQRRNVGVLWKALGGLAVATQAVGQSGDEDLTTEATELLDRTRRDLYRLLAEAEVDRDDPTDDEEITDGEIIEE